MDEGGLARGDGYRAVGEGIQVGAGGISGAVGGQLGPGIQAFDRDRSGQHSNSSHFIGSNSDFVGRRFYLAVIGSTVMAPSHSTTCRAARDLGTSIMRWLALPRKRKDKSF